MTWKVQKSVVMAPERVGTYLTKSRNEYKFFKKRIKNTLKFRIKSIRSDQTRTKLYRYLQMLVRLYHATSRREMGLHPSRGVQIRKVTTPQLGCRAI